MPGQQNPGAWPLFLQNKLAVSSIAVLCPFTHHHRGTSHLTG
jgi:hypothetical protein